MKILSILLTTFWLVQAGAVYAQYAGGNGRGDVQLAVAGFSLPAAGVSSSGFAGGNGRGDALALVNATRLSPCTSVGLSSATATASPICSNATTTMTASGLTGTNASVSWWTAAGGTGTQVGTGLTSDAVSPGTYYAYATGNCGSAVEIQVVVASKTNVGLTSAAATASPICSNATTTLTYNGLTGTNASVSWWSGTGGTGTSYGSGTPSSAVSPGTYYARATGDCGSAVEIQVVVGLTTANTFTGSGNWTEGSNWSCGIPPGVADVFSIGEGKNVLLNTNLNISGSLTLNTGSTLTVNPGQQLAVASGGTVDFNGAAVILKSDATGTAAIGNIVGTLIGATNVTVERYIPANQKWRGLCMPLSSATAGNSIFNSWQNNGNIIAGQGVLLWSSTAATGFSLNTNPGASQNIRKYIGGSGFSLLSNTNEPLFSGGKPVPYLVFVTDHYKQGTNVGNMGTGASATTLRATGTLYQGSYTSGTLGAGFHMIPNPYPSAIDFNNVTITGNIENQFWIWDPQLEGFRGFGGYQAFSSGVLAPDGGSYGSNLQWPIIPSGSAFWLNSTGSGTVQMNESSKSNNTTFSVFGRVADNRNQILRMNLLNQSEKLLDGVAAVFNANASMGNDKLDALKFGLGAENIFIRSNNKNLAIEFHPPVQQADTFNLVLNELSQKTYHLQISGKDMDINPNLIAVLEDQYLKKETVLDLNGTNKVEFTVDGQSASSGNRFRVVFRQNATTSVNTLDADKGISVYPNPAIQGQSIQLSFNNQPAGMYRLVLYDIAGVQVMNRVMQHHGGTAVQSVTMPDKIANGNYVVELTDAKGNAKQIKITVQ